MSFPAVFALGFFMVLGLYNSPSWSLVTSGIFQLSCMLGGLK